MRRTRGTRRKPRFKLLEPIARAILRLGAIAEASPARSRHRAAAALAWVAVRRLRRGEREGWLYLALGGWLLLPNPYPWYGLWLAAVAAFAPGTRAAAALLALTLASLLRYLPDAVYPGTPAPIAWLATAGDASVSPSTPAPSLVWYNQPLTMTTAELAAAHPSRAHGSLHDALVAHLATSSRSISVLLDAPARLAPPCPATSRALTRSTKRRPPRGPALLAAVHRSLGGTLLVLVPTADAAERTFADLLYLSRRRTSRRRLRCCVRATKRVGAIESPSERSARMTLLADLPPGRRASCSRRSPLCDNT